MPLHPFNDRGEWKLFIGGEWVPGRAEPIDVLNPATGEVLGAAPAANKDDVDDAVSAAKDAYKGWRRTPPEKRGGMLFQIADIIKEHRQELIELETWENGKPLIQSARDVDNAERTFRFYGGAADKFYGQTVLDSVDEMRKITYEPYGVVAAIIPWNWPPMHTADFGALALATGNSVVMKPSPDAPLSTLRIAELIADILPPGVFNVIPGGIEPGAELVVHPGVDFVTFTGSSATGAKIMAAAAPRITPLMMELGGKNASLVFADSDLNKAVKGMLRSAFFNSGQACSGTERILVEGDIYQQFLDMYTAEVEKMVVSHGFDEHADVGPVVNQRQQMCISGHIDTAVAHGATIAAQSPLPTDESLSGGYWIPPTVLTGLPADAEILREEVFGPVACVVPFDGEEEAIEIANSVDYGLTAGIWTENLSRAHRMATEIEAGLVAINTVNGGRLGLPFGGYKRSGIGRKKDMTEAMRTFSRVKSVHIDLT